ncbi:hypothetical protein Nepgr_000635 [Nepenthes gracilis]|uniref:Uncharacterized protein n=1 Tax=Nepenthes gracilis TaxID=150966 RepID=A0AAD3P3A7_NEPGR|nr:hypothetical protein Nepgr_000635 [Nepenthes gracilis]
MISVLAQERLLGFALGTAFTAGIVMENRRGIHKMIAENNAKLGNLPQMKRPIGKKKPHLEFAHLWNKAVDMTFGPVIASLSTRGW